MDVDFPGLMSQKTDEGLQNYINDSERYKPEAVAAAITEMQKRGKTFSEEELAMANQKIERQKEAMEKFEELPNDNWKKNVVYDPGAPMYYSERAIYWFSIIFGVLFGSILLAINLKEIEAKKGKAEVVVFGVAFTVLQIWVLSMVQKTSGSYLFGILGALVLNKFFWKKYIGKDVKYRIKPIWGPLIIGIAIMMFIVAMMIYGDEGF